MRVAPQRVSEVVANCNRFGEGFVRIDERVSKCRTMCVRGASPLYRPRQFGSNVVAECAEMNLEVMENQDPPLSCATRGSNAFISQDRGPRPRLCCRSTPAVVWIFR